MTSDRSQRSETTTRRRRRWGLLGAFVALALLLAACGSDDDAAESGVDEETSTEAAEPMEGDASDDGGFDVESDGQAASEDDAMEEEAGDVDDGADRALSEGDPGSPLGAGGTQVTPTAADLGRKLIFTAFLTVGVDDVAAASAEATSVIEGLGGFLFGQSTEGGPNARSELTFKVLPDDFNLALERLGAVGELRNQTVTTDDVTERVVDLESRIEVAELGVARLRAALEGSQSLEDYAEIERLLLGRESDLEVMRGQLRTLQDRIDLATITLVLSQERVENGVVVDVTSYEGHDGGRLCPGQSGRSVEEGSDVTVCFEVTNIGDQTLVDIALTDTVLEIDSETELLSVFGDLTELAPGQSALVAYETRVERTQRLRTRVAAVPTDGLGGERGPAVQAEGEAEIRTFASEDPPGFGDGFGVAVDILRGLWTALIVTIGFLIPLLILLPFAWLAWKGWQALRRNRPGGSEAAPPPPPLAPPPPPPADPVAEATVGGGSDQTGGPGGAGGEPDATS